MVNGVLFKSFADDIFTLCWHAIIIEGIAIDFTISK
jgi:hypothetical protein